MTISQLITGFALVIWLKASGHECAHLHVIALALRARFARGARFARADYVHALRVRIDSVYNGIRTRFAHISLHVQSALANVIRVASHAQDH